MLSPPTLPVLIPSVVPQPPSIAESETVVLLPSGPAALPYEYCVISYSPQLSSEWEGLSRGPWMALINNHCLGSPQPFSPLRLFACIENAGRGGWVTDSPTPPTPRLQRIRRAEVHAMFCASEVAGGILAASECLQILMRVTSLLLWDFHNSGAGQGHSDPLCCVLGALRNSKRNLSQLFRVSKSATKCWPWPLSWTLARGLGEGAGSVFLTQQKVRGPSELSGSPILSSVVVFSAAFWRLEPSLGTPQICVC